MPWPLGERPPVTPTQLDVLTRRYAHGFISLDVYEAALTAMLAAGVQHDPAAEPHWRD